MSNSSRRKHLKGIDEEDLEFINSKMKSPELNENYEYVDGYKNQLRLLNYKIDIKCKNEKQKQFLNQMKDENKDICFGIGSPGTGKSFLSLSYALKVLKEGRYSTITMIVPTAPAVEADMNLGYLKGDLQSKVEPYKAADKETIKKILKLSGNVEFNIIANALFNSGLIKYEFVNYLLGKDLSDTIILVNEAEQYTKSNMRLILTRIGENSKFIITGDCKQTNRKLLMNKKDENGLSFVAERLSDLDEISITEFTDDEIVRNKLITKILQRID